MAAYSFLDVSASFGGPTGSFPLGAGSGNAEEGITIDAIEDKNTMVIGADGKGMHSLHAGNAATVTVRLLKTSPRNQQLRTAYNTQKSSSALWGQNTIIVTDTARGDSTTLRDVAFKKPAPITYAKDGGNLEWVFDAIIADVILGSGTPSR